MPRYNIHVLGLEVSFKAEADHQRINDAKNLVVERFEKLDQHGRQISKEKLLTFLALGLADDLLQTNQRLATLEERLNQLVVKIDAES